MLQAAEPQSSLAQSVQPQHSSGPAIPQDSSPASPCMAGELGEGQVLLAEQHTTPSQTNFLGWLKEM